ncbi:hypothetical protein JGI25_01619, partial [Candidatus Kryptobacter tengchongensis]
MVLVNIARQIAYRLTHGEISMLRTGVTEELTFTIRMGSLKIPLS